MIKPLVALRWKIAGVHYLGPAYYKLAQEKQVGRYKKLERGSSITDILKDITRSFEISCNMGMQT